MVTPKKPTPNTDSELDRVLSNPTNLIMSDSLDGVLDAAVLEEPEVWDVGNFTCFLNFQDTVLGGTLRSFSVKGDCRILMITSTDDAAIHLIKEQHLKSYVCKSIYGDIIDSREVNSSVEITVQFDDEQQTALVTVKIPGKEDS